MVAFSPYFFEIINNKAIVDLKTVDDLYKGVYCDGVGKLNFIQAKGYDFQLAVYQKVVELNTGKQLPCYIAAVDKTKFETQEEYEAELDRIKEHYMGKDKYYRQEMQKAMDELGISYEKTLLGQLEGSESLDAAQ